MITNDFQFVIVLIFLSFEKIEKIYFFSIKQVVSKWLNINSL